MLITSEKIHSKETANSVVHISTHLKILSNNGNKSANRLPAFPQFLMPHKMNRQGPSNGAATAKSIQLCTNMETIYAHFQRVTVLMES